MGCLIFRVAVGALFLMASSFAQAADMTGYPEEPAPQAVEPPPMVELGTGWYLRGDATFAKEVRPKISFNLQPLNTVNLSQSWAAGIGGGYKFTNWFRADLTFDYRNDINAKGSAVVGSPPACAVPLTGCTLNFGGGWNNRWTTLVNGYLDLGSWSSITPYIGAGVGVSHMSTTGHVIYINNDTGLVLIPFTNLSSRNITQFTWAVMAGIAADVAPHTKIDIGYRLIDVGRTSNVSSLGLLTTASLYSNELRIGFRYTPD